MTDRQETLPSSRQSQPRRRRPWLAALLSFFAPGVGQLYDGEPRLAVVFFALFALLNFGFFFGLTNFHPDPPVLGAFLAITLSSLTLQITAAVRAFTHARRVAPAPIAPYQRGWIYLLAVVVLPLINFFGAPPWIASYYAPSGSNIPTILVGDRFFVEVGYYRAHAPKRGEMIVFISPKDGHISYVKRLVGLPGETIQMHEGKLSIAGQAVPRRQIEDYSDRSDGAPILMHQYVETLPGGASYRVLGTGDDGPLDNTPVFNVPAAHYFTLGDNRDNSLDSRSLSQFGYVPAANLVGRAYIVYWPLSRRGLKFD